MLNPLPYATYAFIMSITPGPNNVMLTTAGAHFGLRRTLPQILGIVAGGALLMTGSCTGLGVLFARWPVLHTVLEWVGAAYLVYLGWRLLGAGAIKAGEAARPIAFGEAVGFQFLNPKAWIMSLTSATLFLPVDLPPLAAGAFMVGIMALVNLPCCMVWALFGSSMRLVLQRPLPRRLFNGAMALALVATSVMMVIPD